jgi:pimeloyl-ACP methyl ester carboxylesterase
MNSLKTIYHFIVFSIIISLPSRAQFVSFDGTKINYEMQGEGPPVVLIHGYIVDGSMWKKSTVYQSLLDAGYMVIVPDLRGNGLSDKPHTLAAYQNDAEARDIMALMAHLHFKKYDVVGYSRGAIITARLLVLDKNVQNAVLGGMGADFTNPDWVRPKMFKEAFAGQAAKWPEIKQAILYAKSIGADTTALSLMQEAQPVTTAKALKRISKPVLIISGDQDTDNGKAADLAALLSNSTLKTVPGTHNNTSASEGFAEAVLQFLYANK